MSVVEPRMLVFDQKMKDERDYWVGKLSGRTEPANLRLDYPRPESYSAVVDTVEVNLPEAVCQKLAQLTGNGPFLLYTTLMSALMVCLHKYMGGGDTSIAVGSPALKEDPHLQGMSNSLAIVCEIKDQLPFRQILLDIRQTLLDAYARQHYPFARLVKDMGRGEVENKCALFDIALILKDIHGDMPAVKNDITMTFAREQSRVAGRVAFNVNVFKRDTIERFIEHVTNILRAGIENINALISELPMTTEAERYRLSVEWNETRTEPRDERICDLFEAQVEQFPDSVAVTFNDQHLTYRDLNQRSNQMADYLQELGVGPDVLVGICSERSLEMVVGLLGILKAGGAYVPLDPMYPKGHLAVILEDSQISVVLARREASERLPEHKARIVRLDTDWDIISKRNSENFVSRVTGEALVYVIHTSGSTGRPKGVMVSHRALVNHAQAMIKVYGLTSAHRLLQFISPSFDAAGEEIFPTLLSGATLVLPEIPSGLLAHQLASFCEQQSITILHLPVTLCHQLVDYEGLSSRSRLPSLKVLLTGGEQPILDKLRSLAGQLGVQVEFLNAYGPTEATITSTVYNMTHDVKTSKSLGKVPIGRPIANAQVYILDIHQQPVAVGAIGELYIGGAGLARGYLNRPELTAEAFVPNPFVSQQRGEIEGGTRLYKTGDLARYLPDGNIEFLGRVDHQVKVRGFRIELGEIEAALNRHPAIREVIVVAQDGESGDKHLVAFVVFAQGRSVTITESRKFLQERLPEYMLPSAFVELDALPLTPGGKVDRRALPTFKGIKPDLKETAYVAPRTPVEKSLVEIWKQVLKVERIGIYDRFFDLGGDSILSIQVVARSNQAGLPLTPRQVFDHQTIAELAAVVGAGRKVEAEQGIVTGPLPLTPIQRWFFEYVPIEPWHWNQALLLETQVGIRPAMLARVVSHLMAHHDALRLRFVRRPDGWEQTDAGLESEASFCWVDLSSLPQDTHRARIETAAAEVQKSLNLEEGPLFRAVFFCLGADQAGRMLIVMHHLIVDTVSWQIWLEDLRTGYEQIQQGKSIMLPAKTTSFKEWAESLEKYAQSAPLQDETNFWLSGTRRRPPSLPVDYPERGANTVATTESVAVSLSSEETEMLLQKVTALYQTEIIEVLLMGLARAFSHWTGQSGLLIDLERHGREEDIGEVDLSRTMGWFTTAFPLRLDISDGMETGKALKAIQEQIRSVPKQGIGYGVLRYLSKDQNVVEKLRALPQAVVSFNYLGRLDNAWGEQTLFALAHENCGPVRSLQGSRYHLLEINAIIIDGRLEVAWTYSANIHKRSTIERLAQDYIEQLRIVIEHCQSSARREYAPSDFPLAKLDEKKLYKLARLIDRTKEERHEAGKR